MTSTDRIGIDPQTDRVLVARVTSGADSLLECSIESRAASDPAGSLSHAPITIAVPDHEVAVKSLYLPPSASLDFLSRASFELSQSVLEPPDRFHFDAVPTSMRDRYIGLIYRQERLQLLKGKLLVGQNGSIPEPRYLMRAIALGHGYNRFAQPDSDSLLCLADLAGGTVSLCLLYNRTTVAVGHMVAGALTPTDDRSMRAFGIDLKSLLNYLLAGCAEHGLSVPLSAVVMCGGLARPSVLDSLAPLFSARVVMPRLPAEGVRFDSSDESISFADSLAALGLTVN